MDHLAPKSSPGRNRIYKRAPICSHHNIRKNSRRLHPEGYRKEIADADEMMVDTIDELAY